MWDKSKYRKYYKAYMRNVRTQALIALSDGGDPRCARCGFSDVRALQIDHIDSDGSSHRKDRQHTCIYLDIARGRNTTPVQILCANCNWIKRHESNEVLGRPRVHGDSQYFLYGEEEQ